MRLLTVAILAAAVLGGCGAAAAPTTTPAATAAPVATAAAPTASPTPTPVQSFKSGAWPPEWQRWICAARAQMLREDAKAGGLAGEDAATQAITDLKSTTINWDPGGDLRALVGKAAFILLDAAPRGGNAMADVPPAIKIFERAYSDLKDATGFECPA